MYCLFNKIYFDFKYVNILKNNFFNFYPNYYFNTFNNRYFFNKNLFKNSKIKFNLNKKNYFFSNLQINNFFLKNFTNIIFNYFKKSFNFLFIDNNIKMMLPIYSQIFSLKNVYSNKNFFFIKKNFLTLNNWLYIYTSFLKKNNINLLFFLDYFYFNKFFNIFNKLNLPIISLTPNNIKSVYIDYSFYINFLDLNIAKLVFYNYITSLFFYNYNYKNYKIKFNFYKNIIKIKNIKNIL